MKAAYLYHIRSMTGCMSGEELCGLFVDLIGEPSPSGATDIPLDKWYSLLSAKDDRAMAFKQIAMPEQFHQAVWLDGSRKFTNRVAQAFAANGLYEEAGAAETGDWQMDDHVHHANRTDIPHPYAFLGW